ncbi:MAG: lipid II:glycine glycyltransferase FemX [Patescibacteria group bacterium]|jgi:lipid II:glycine glycyltransferase (peptidoglycan interpeptide bridge formation enzyme)
MKIVNLSEDKTKLKILNQSIDSELLQSSYWQELVKSDGEEGEIWGLLAGEAIVASALIIKKQIISKFHYYYLPRGPWGAPDKVVKLLTELDRLKSSAIFWRLEPVSQTIIEALRSAKNFKYLIKTIDWQPSQTWLLDLRKSEAELLAGMHSKTRYNLRLAKRKGVVVTEGTEADLDEFWRLLKATGGRDGFRLHPKTHYQNLLKLEPLKLFIARHQGQAIAGGLFSFFGERVTYLHGASDYQARSLMAPQLLQWSVILKAQKLNQERQNTDNQLFKDYDFYGIDKQRWPGVTRFKLGFGGRARNYPGTYDLSNKYLSYQVYKLFRQLRRLF